MPERPSVNDGFDDCRGDNGANGAETRPLKDIDGKTDSEESLSDFAKSFLQDPVEIDSIELRTHVLSAQADVFESEFIRLGTVELIDKAIKSRDQVLSITPTGHTERPCRLNSLGNSYLRRFQRLGELEDLDKSIEYQSQAVLLTSDGHEENLRGLSGLGSSYLCRFERLGEGEDIDKAIEYQSQVVQATSGFDPDMPSRLNNLGTSYLCRFERHGELVDVDKAIKYQNQALLLTPDGDAAKAGRLNNLGGSYMRRFERQGELPDIAESIKCHVQAVLLTPEGHAAKPSRLGNLGNSYLRRFNHLGELTDVDRAIENLSQAVLLTPDDHPGKPSWLKSLGASYAYRFDRLEELADIDQAIVCQIQAALLTPDDHADKLVVSNNLGNAYQRRFFLLKDISDINVAIQFQSPAVQLTPDDCLDKPMMLSNLGSSYLYRFEHLGELADIDEAIECGIQALQLTPDDHADKPRWLGNLGNSYQRRFDHFGEASDIEKAIDYQCQAIRHAPDDHAEAPKWLHNLGRSYMSRFERHRALTDVEHAQLYFQKAAQQGVGSPVIQMRSARAWAKSLSLLNISPLVAYRRALDLVPHLVWLGNTIAHRYDLMQEVRDLATEAAAAAISHREYARALEWLEEGRSIVWNQTLQLRTSMRGLAVANPAMAERLEELGRELGRTSSRSEAFPSISSMVLESERETQRHHDLAIEWNQLLEQTRDVPGFDNFLRPPTLEHLMQAAKGGPVIVVNVHQGRCDALIIQPGENGIAHVPLKNFSLEKATDASAQLLSGHRGGRSRGITFKRRQPFPKPENLIKQILVALWSDVVQPILDFLGYRHKLPIDDLPHVTWCTTGALSFLPLHAAGCYDGMNPNAFDLVISSYTPTLSALQAVSRPPPNQYPGVLAVGQEFTEGFGDLPNIVKELAVIKEHVPQAAGYMQLDGNSATVSTVLNAMGQYSWIHLACHATQNKEDRAQSAFHLHDGDLTLSAITQQSLKNKGLAFLSACQTATGDDKLPDEALHLAAGMLMAGYPSVIATMWAIQDEDAPEIARQVYADLLKDEKMDGSGAARALHKAVAYLRGRLGHGESAFERWVPFIHVGI